MIFEHGLFRLSCLVSKEKWTQTLGIFLNDAWFYVPYVLNAMTRRACELAY